MRTINVTAAGELAIVDCAPAVAPRPDLWPSTAAHIEATVRIGPALAASNLRHMHAHVAPSAPLGRAHQADLALALAASGVQDRTVFLGSVDHDGELRSVNGLLPMIDAAIAAGATAVVVPVRQWHEATLALPGARIFAAECLRDVAGFVERTSDLPQIERLGLPRRRRERPDLWGIPRAIAQALVGAASHAASLLVIGPWQTGHALQACRALTEAMPPLDDAAAREVLYAQSWAGLLGPSTSVGRPLRAPHHSVAADALRGAWPHRVGELHLARHGVLLLDEVAEFSRGALTAVRENRNTGVVVVATAPECPCSRTCRACSCSELTRASYSRRLEELRGSFDVVLEVSYATFDDLVPAAWLRSALEAP